MSRILLLLAAFFLVACGNIDQGKSVRRYRSDTGSVNLNPTQPSSGAAYGNCKSFAVYGGTNPSYAQTFAGASACASTSQLNLVKLKTSAYFPTETRFCLVPLSVQGAFDATCFVANGQVEISLSTQQFTAVALVRESDLGAYVTYLSRQSSAYPPMAYANLR